MPNQWFINQSGVVVGPVTAVELRLRAGDGRLKSIDRVSPDGRRWKNAGQIKGLHLAEIVTQAVAEQTDVLPILVGTKPLDESFPGYSINSVVGSGACGVVYRAKHLQLNRVVALKTIRLESTTSETALARFDREAVALARLQHPNIVSVYDYGRRDGRVYLAMELLEGEDLEQRIKGLGSLDERTAWSVARQTAVALAYATELGIIHRDIKPANLFLTSPPIGIGLPQDLPMVKVMDFGLAFTKQLDFPAQSDRLTCEGAVVGTPAYMAPEQFSNSSVDHRADLYALGATIFHALSGRPPFEGTTFWEVSLKKSKSDFKLPSSVSKESALLVAEMLAPNLAHRISSYEELIRRIDSLPILTGATHKLPILRTRTYKHVLWIAAALVIVVASLVLLSSDLFAGSPRLANGPPPTVVTSGRREMLSDRARLANWQIEGKVTFEPDDDGAQVLTTTGSVRWNYQPSEVTRISVGLDLHKADSVDLLFADNLALRINRNQGVVIGVVRADETFQPLTLSASFPSPEAREGLVPYLSVELQHVGDRWDVWFDHKHLGGIRASESLEGMVMIRSSGRAVRVERIELERGQPKN